MSIIRWTPVRDVTPWNVSDLTSEFAQMQREIDRMFDRFVQGGNVADSTSSTWLPAVDIGENDHGYEVLVELPGIKKDDVKITVANDVLTIKGEKKLEKETKAKNVHRSERCYGSFQRSFVLPTMVQSEKIEASYNDGILTIMLPKMEEAKPKQIEVKVK